MEQLRQQFLSCPDNKNDCKSRDKKYQPQRTRTFKNLKQLGITYPLSASGRNWNGTETIWPTISI